MLINLSDTSDYKYKIRTLSVLLNPALPSLILLTGIIFCFAAAHFVGVQWHFYFTLTFYVLLSIWVGWLYWIRRQSISNFGMIDALFCLFVMIVILSLVLTGFHHASVRMFGKYIPFMVIVPFLCGRLIRLNDILLLSRLFTWAALVMLLLLSVFYLLNATALKASRDGLPLFGFGHSSLLVGMLLAVSLVTLSFQYLSDNNRIFPNSAIGQTLSLTALGFISFALVWVSARGALIAGILGVLCIIVSARWRTVSSRIVLFAFIMSVMIFTFVQLPRPQAHLYAHLTDTKFKIFQYRYPLPKDQSKQFFILGEDACLVFKMGRNSAAMRSVLYQESIALFLEAPLAGVGASSFGNYSCIGKMGFPHSTIMQSFAELGSIGGIVFVVLIGAVLTEFMRGARLIIPLAERKSIWLVFSIFVVYLTSDQIYGNYFMATGFYLLAGVTSSMYNARTASNHRR